MRHTISCNKYNSVTEILLTRVSSLRKEVELWQKIHQIRQMPTTVTILQKTAATLPTQAMLLTRTVLPTRQRTAAKALRKTVTMLPMSLTAIKHCRGRQPPLHNLWNRGRSHELSRYFRKNIIRLSSFPGAASGGSAEPGRFPAQPHPRCRLDGLGNSHNGFS